MAVAEFEKDEFFRFSRIEAICARLKELEIQGAERNFFESVRQNMDTLFESPRRAKRMTIGTLSLTAAMCDKTYVKCEGQLLGKLRTYCQKGTSALTKGDYKTFFGMWYHTRPDRRYLPTMASGIAKKSKRFASPLHGILKGNWTVWQSTCAKRLVALAPQPWQADQRLGVAFCHVDGKILFFEDFRTPTLESVRYANLPPAKPYQRRKSARVAKFFHAAQSQRNIIMAANENKFLKKMLQAEKVEDKLGASWDYRIALETYLNSNKTPAIDPNLLSSGALIQTVRALEPLCSGSFRQQATNQIGFFQKVLGYVHCVSTSSMNSSLNQFRAPQLELYHVKPQELRDEILGEVRGFRQLLKAGKSGEMEARSWVQKKGPYAQFFNKDVKDYTKYMPQVFGPYLTAVADGEEVEALMSGFGDQILVVPTRWAKSPKDAPKSSILELRLGSSGVWQIFCLRHGTYLGNASVQGKRVQPFRELALALLQGRDRPGTLGPCDLRELLDYRAKLELAFFSNKGVSELTSSPMLLKLTHQAMELCTKLEGKDQLLAAYCGAYFAAIDAVLRPMCAVESSVILEKFGKQERSFAGFSSGVKLLTDEDARKEIHNRFVAISALIDQRKFNEAADEYGLAREHSISRAGNCSHDLQSKFPASLKDLENVLFLQPGNGLFGGCLMISQEAFVAASTSGPNSSVRKQPIGCYFLQRRRGWLFVRTVSYVQFAERFPQMVRTMIPEKGKK